MATLLFDRYRVPGHLPGADTDKHRGAFPHLCPRHFVVCETPPQPFSTTPLRPRSSTRTRHCLHRPDVVVCGLCSPSIRPPDGHSWCPRSSTRRKHTIVIHFAEPTARKPVCGQRKCSRCFASGKQPTVIPAHLVSGIQHPAPSTQYPAGQILMPQLCVPFAFISFPNVFRSRAKSISAVQGFWHGHMATTKAERRSERSLETTKQQRKLGPRKRPRG